jgi:hypothetical protein
MELLDQAEGEYRDISPNGLQPMLASALSDLQTQVPQERATLQNVLDGLNALFNMFGQ